MSLAVGLAKCAPGLTLGPTNSLVVAAVCHPLENDYDAAKRTVRWGAIPNENNTEYQHSTGHCTITSRRVEAPIEGRWYA